jgi:hypothetical protein
VSKPRTSDERLVRDLAKEVAELAQSEEMEARRWRWRDVNALRKPDRAPVWCRPAGVWREILPPEAIKSRDVRVRPVEYALRQHLYKAWVGDDHIIEPWWPAQRFWECPSVPPFGLQTGVLEATTELGGWRLVPPIVEDDDFDRVAVPDYDYDPFETELRAAELDSLLGDILPVRLTGAPPLDANTLNTGLDQLRGMNAFMLDLYERPERIHRAMAKLCEAVLAAMRQADALGLLAPNNHGGMFESDPVGSPPYAPTRLHHLWGAANSQEFDEVSPAMFDEFLLTYQRPILAQYGLTQYGCCEDLTRKIDLVLRIPNLRVFVCSAWTDLDRVIEACDGRYTIMWRQPAGEVTLADDTDGIARHLDEGMRKLRGQCYQVVLREVETLAGHPERIREWARLAIGAAERHS